MGKDVKPKMNSVTLHGGFVQPPCLIMLNSFQHLLQSGVKTCWLNSPAALLSKIRIVTKKL